MTGANDSEPDIAQAAACVRLLRALAAGPRTAGELRAALDWPDTALDAALAHAQALIRRDAGGRMHAREHFDALAAEDVARCLPAAARGAFDLDVVDATGSTNADLVAAAARLPSGHVRAAEWQVAGRGRRGRRWLAPPGAGLAFSILWKFPRGAAHLSGLSLAVGVAVARGLEACGAPPLELKWPNDVLARDGADLAKLCGILIEIAPSAGGPVPVVIGIGINVAPVEAAVGQRVASLAGLGVGRPRHAILAGVLGALAPVLRGFEQEGFAALRAEWNARHAYADTPVVASAEPGAPQAGIARGVDADGALLIDTAAGRVRLIGGEISLRPA